MPVSATRLHLQAAQPSSRRKRGAEHIATAAPQRSDISTRQAAHKPSSAETAKTIVDIVAHGTLATVGEDGVPLGTYVSYILDGRGMPVLRITCAGHPSAVCLCSQVQDNPKQPCAQSHNLVEEAFRQLPCTTMALQASSQFDCKQTASSISLILTSVPLLCYIC